MKFWKDKRYLKFCKDAHQAIMKTFKRKFAMRSSRERFHPQRPKAICSLKQHEWQSLCDLLKQGYPFQDAYLMVDHNERFLRSMEDGMPITDALLVGHRGSFYEHLRFFMEITSLADAISSALTMKSFTKGLRQTLWKQASYPMVLFLFSFFTLFLFSSYVIPQLMQSFDLSAEQSFLPSAVSLLRFLAMGILWLLLVVLVLVLLAQHSMKWKLFLLEHLRITHLPQQYCTYMFAGYYAQLMHHGITTRHAISFLAKQKEGTLLTHCAIQMEHQLQEGIEFSEVLEKQPWIDPAFLSVWRVGIHTQNMEKALFTYRQRQEEQWKQLLKTCSVMMQAVAYGFVGLMVILVYQIMLVPLQILETM